MAYTYLQVNFFAVLVPFIFSFHPKLNFFKTWRAFWPACFLASVPFLVWDIFFTEMGVWGFNPDYLLGIYLWNLPIEECLFFICIPYCCVYTFHCFKLLMQRNPFKKSSHLISPVLIILLIGIGIGAHRWYTSVTFLALGCFLMLHQYVWKTHYLARFYFVYLVLIFPFFLVNGILTGTGLEAPVVWYNNEENLGIRLLTIPIEDIFYGMLLILLNITLYQKFLPKNAR